MKNFLAIIFTVCLLLIFSAPVFANSSYVLPYPSFMPGSIFYKLHQGFEKIQKYWYSGSFAQIEYNLKQSDKYLVEAKTLFEYKQYLLAYQALQKSDDFYKNLSLFLSRAQLENKNIVQKQAILKSASLKHIEVLNALKNEVPLIFVWKPEKSTPTTIYLHLAIKRSIEMRQKYL